MSEVFEAMEYSSVKGYCVILAEIKRPRKNLWKLGSFHLISFTVIEFKGTPVSQLFPYFMCNFL